MCSCLANAEMEPTPPLMAVVSRLVGVLETQMQAGGNIAPNAQDLAMIVRAVANLGFDDSAVFFHFVASFLIRNPAICDSFEPRGAASLLRGFAKAEMEPAKGRITSPA